MIAHRIAARLARGLMALTVVGAAVCSSHAAVIVDSHGFEQPFFSTTFAGTGQLEGQTPATFNGTWLRTKGPGSGLANVQSSVVETGAQAVQVTRIGGSDDRWGIPVDGYPSIPTPYVCITWSMRVEQSTGPAGSFGPFFGVEAYDDDASTVGLLGSLGVDASTGDVLFQAEDTGFLTETGTTVGFGEWHVYQLELNYLNHTYRFAVDGLLLGTQEFVDEDNIPGGLDEFTDANIAAIGAAGDPDSINLGGIAFFDNFIVHEESVACDLIPEPSAAMLAVIGLMGCAARRRRLTS